MKMKSKILIGIFLTLLSTPAYTVPQKEKDAFKDLALCKTICNASTCRVSEDIDTGNKIFKCPNGTHILTDKDGNKINNKKTPATNNTKNKKYTIDEFHKKFQNLKEEYLDLVKDYFAKPDCESVELLGEQDEKEYNELADKTEDLPEKERKNKLSALQDLIKSNNNECYARKDLKAIVTAYNAKKEEFEKAEEAQADAAETQEKQQPENKAS